MARKSYSSSGVCSNRSQQLGKIKVQSPLFVCHSEAMIPSVQLQDPGHSFSTLPAPEVKQLAALSLESQSIASRLHVWEGRKKQECLGQVQSQGMRLLRICQQHCTSI